MPTNILRNSARAAAVPAAGSRAPALPRRLLLTAGRVRILIEPLGTLTAQRLLTALPLYSTAETWGEALHFEVPVQSGRERGARLSASPGDICFWPDEHRIIVAYGPTPISRPGERRLPSPCNVFARAIDDASLLKTVRPGEKVSLQALPD